MKAVHKILVPGDGQQLSVSLACDKDIDVFFFLERVNLLVVQLV